MKDYLKQIKGEFLLSSVMCILLGIVLIFWGDKTLLMLGWIFGAILVLIGVVNLIGFFLTSMVNKVTGVLGAAVLFIGIWVLLDPGVVASMVPVVIGVILIFHGVKAVTVALESRQYGDSRWIVGVILAAISLLLGALCILNAFHLMKMAFAGIGIALIYNGASNIWLAVRTNKAAKTYHMEHDTIDVEFKD